MRGRIDSNPARRGAARARRRAGCALVALAMALGAADLRAQAKDWPSERAPRPLAAREIAFPPYEVRTLANGLQVVAVPHHEEPAVSLRLIVRAGSALAPPGKLGLADLVASLLDQGTTTRSAQALNDQIDFIGGAVRTGAGSDLSFVNVVVMKDSFDAALEMLSDMAEHPAFAPEEVDRQRQQIVSGLQVSMQDPAWIANAVFDRLVYGFNPYGLPDSGTPATMAGITRGDLVAFHDTYYAPNNAILAVVGDVTAEEAFDGATRVFGSWPRREIPKQEVADTPRSARRVVIVDKPDAVQTEIRVGHIGIKRNDSDYMPLNIAIRILGGEGSNRLQHVLRTERGLTYGAQADMDTLRYAGDFEAETNTRSDATGEVLRLIVDEFWRLQRERVGQSELDGAKAYMTGSFPLTIETPDDIAVQVLNALVYGLPLDQLQTYRQRVNAVTVDDIERVARYYLKPEAVSVVLVGNAAAFMSELRGVGFGKYEVVPIDQLDLLAPDFKRAAAGLPGDAEKAGRAGGARVGRMGRPGAVVVPAAFRQGTAGAAPSVAPDESREARALLAKVIAAKGGLAALGGIRNVKVVTSTTVRGTAGEMSAMVTTYLEYPDHVHVETALPDQGTQMQIFDGEHGWVRDSVGTRDVPEAGLRDLEASLKREVVGALLAADRGELRARLLPDVKDADGRLQHALELSSPSLDPFVFYIDPATYLIAKEVFVDSGPGRPIVEESFSDYRAVDGVQVAFVDTVRTGGRQLLTRRVTDIRFNTALDPTLFKRPSS